MNAGGRRSRVLHGSRRRHVRLAPSVNSSRSLVLDELVADFGKCSRHMLCSRCCEHCSGVNYGHGYDSALERDLAQVLAELLSSASWLQEWRIGHGKAGERRTWDLVVSGPVPGRGKAVSASSARAPTSNRASSSLVPLRLAGQDAVSAKVLAMPRVSPRMAALCQEHGWSWYDLAGNCRLEIPGVLLIERSGKEPVKAQPRVGANLGTPEAGRVVRALLAPENAGQRWTQREMVAHFADLVPSVPAPSLALVNKVIQHLRDQAFLDAAPESGLSRSRPRGAAAGVARSVSIRSSQPSPLLHPCARARSPGEAPCARSGWPGPSRVRGVLRRRPSGAGCAPAAHMALPRPDASRRSSNRPSKPSLSIQARTSSY